MNTEKRLYQWDTGQKLEGCTGLYVDFPIDNEVYRVETADGMCIIPDELLQTSGSHKVYECMTNNTIRSFAFSVTPRPKPPDYVYTPTERLTFEGLVQKVDDAVADMIRKAESGEFDGHTPIKGTDYFTTSEIQQIQNEVSSGAIGDFKSVVDTETETFNTNAETKLNAYNQNDSQKTDAYNSNATKKLNAYNSNAESKLNAYNTNANNRVAEFDTHTEQIQTDISGLKSDLTQQKEYIFEDIPKEINISKIENITFKEGWNASDGSSSIQMSKNASYDTYYFITDRDCDIYVKSVSVGYFAIIYGGQYQSIIENENSLTIYCAGGSVRVRNTDGNLPTETNKLHIAKGSVVAFTISHGADQAIYGVDNGIKVKDLFKEEIITSIPSNKKSYIQYVTGSIEGSASEGLNIFLPTKVGYIRYAFVHTVSESLHADVWRIHRAYAVDDSFNDRFLLTTTGEWEMAVHLPSRADFSGGYAHGDEIMESITFIVDGKITDITALTNRTEFNRIEIIQDSDVYDPNDSTTIFAKHGSKHIFDSKMNDHIVIEQALKFTSSQTMTTCYMAMFPPAKVTTNAYYEDINFKDTLITTYPIVVDEAREVTIHSEDVGFIARFSIPKTVETSNLTSGNHLKIHDNGGSDYNKCYYTLCGDANVVANEVWKTQTNYNLEMVK